MIAKATSKRMHPCCPKNSSHHALAIFQTPQISIHARAKPIPLKLRVFLLQPDPFFVVDYQPLALLCLPFGIVCPPHLRC